MQKAWLVTFIKPLFSTYRRNSRSARCVSVPMIEHLERREVLSNVALDAFPQITNAETDPTVNLNYFPEELNRVASEVQPAMLQSSSVLAAVTVAEGSNLLAAKGSFEFPSLTGEGNTPNPPTWDLIDLSGWSATSPAVNNKVELHRTGALTGIAAPDGSQYIELDGDENGPNGPPITGRTERGRTTIKTSVDVEKDRSYRLVVAVGGRPGTVSAENNVRVVVKYSGGATLFDTTTGATAPGTWRDWERSFSIPAGAASSRLDIELSDAGATDNALGSLLDNVRLIAGSRRSGEIRAKRTIAGGELLRKIDALSDVPSRAQIKSQLVESATSIKPSEHFETGSTFEFSVTSGPLMQYAASQIVGQVLKNGVLVATARSNGRTFAHAFPEAGSANHQIRFFRDTNGNRTLDAGEPTTGSDSFLVQNTLVRKVDMGAARIPLASMCF